MLIRLVRMALKVLVHFQQFSMGLHAQVSQAFASIDA